MGTDWRDSDPKVEPIVEIYQGCRQNYEMPGAPRANTAEKSLGGWRPLGFVSRALMMGIRFGSQSSSDHGATDNILAAVHCGEHFMDDELTTTQKPTLRILLEGTQPFAKVHVIKDNKYVYTTQPKKQRVEFQWTDMAPKAGTSGSRTSPDAAFGRGQIADCGLRIADSSPAPVSWPATCVGIRNPQLNACRLRLDGFSVCCAHNTRRKGSSAYG